MVRETGPYSSTLTSEEAAYLETLGFVPSSWSASVFVLPGKEANGTPAITAVIERVQLGSWTALAFRWKARTPITRNRRPIREVEANDLTALVVMAKLEEIF